jgi:hypothetical protein
LADLSDLEKRSPHLIPIHQPIGDRASKRLKMGRFCTLIFSTLTIQFSCSFSKAQISNELVFERLVTHSVIAQGHPIDSVKGFVTDVLNAQILRTPSAAKDLIIEPPTVEFTRLGKGMWERSVATIVNYQDSMEHSYSLAFKDTLTAKEIKVVRKTRYPELRGKNPRFTSKYLGPALLIGTAIAGIISLFYLRS